MSIGKRPSEGNRGNDLSYRSRLLRGLAEIAGNTGATGSLNQEVTQLAVLNTLQNLLAENKLDFEIKSVKDANGDVFQLRGTLDEETGVFTWDYIDAEGNAYNIGDPGGPVAPVEFLNPDGLLVAIETELLDQGLTLDAIQTEQLAQGLSLDSIVTNTTGLATQLTLNDLLTAFNAEDFAQEVTSQLINSNIVLGNLTLNGIKTQTDLLNFIATALEVNVTSSALPTGAATEVTLASLNAKLNTLGQKASAASLPAVLSTEQEALLNAIKTAVENIDSDLGTGGLALETTQQAIETLITSTNALLTTIDADTSNLDVLLSTRAADASVLATNALLTTIDGVLDAIKIDTGALVVDVAAIEVLITTTNSLLTTIDGVLDAIKLDTANLDVALSTVATELTVAKLLDPIGTDSVAHGASQKGIRALGTDGTNDQQISTDVDGKVNVLVAAPVALDAGTLLALETVQIGNAGLGNAVNIQDGGNSITVDNTNLDTALTPATRTHNYAVSNGVGSVPAGSLCGSVLNNGNSVGTWNGNALPAGVSIPWSPIGAARDTYGAIPFDATGTEFIIEYTT